MVRLFPPRHVWSGIGFGAALTVALAVVAWAGFTGPNRTTTQSVRDLDSEHWYCVRLGVTCNFAPGVNPCPPEGSHPSSGAVLSVCGWSSGYSCGCDQVWNEETITLPPATVGGAATCGQPGNAGWCRAGASLDFSANEPLSGEVIEVIEGNPGGVLCDPADGSSVACSWSGGEGNFTLQYWAVSSYGDTSDMGSEIWRVDSSPPSVGLNLSGGTLGGGGWYRAGTITVSVTGADSVSGLASAEVSIDGGAWGSTGQVSGDGLHSATGRTRDVAGNEATGVASISYDGTPPTLAAELDGTLGRDGWYLSAVTASVSASDNLSGVAGQEVNVDGTGWRGGSVVIGADGSHSLTFRAVDVAGNLASGGPTSVRIDTHPPDSVFIVPPNGSETWVSGVVELLGQSVDSGSGLRGVEISYDGGGAWKPLALDGSQWGDRWDTRSVPNGTYLVLARASDVAGHQQATARVTLRVDNLPPYVDIPDLWSVDELAPLVVREQGNGLAGAQILIQNGEQIMFRFDYAPDRIPGTIRWNGELPDGTRAAAGDYVVVASAWDLAGNRGQDFGRVRVGPALLDLGVAELLAAVAPGPESGSQPAAERVTAASPATAESPVDRIRLWVWPALAWLGLAGGLAAAKIADPRPAALNRLRQELDHLRLTRTE